MPGVPTDSGNPAWSSNGMLLAFSSPQSGMRQIYAVNAAGKARERLTHGNVPAIDPEWSPQTRAIVFCRVHNEISNIYVLAIFPRRLTRLTNHAEVDLDPKWSPGGKTIAYASNRTGRFEVYEMDADGSHQRQLTTQPGANTGPAWAPGSEQLAYTNTAKGTSNVYAIRLSDGASRQITTAGGADPAWSPDGQRIAFTRSGGIWSVPASGEATDAAATQLAAVGTDPSWAPLLNAVAEVAHGTATVKLPSGQTITLGTPQLPLTTQPTGTPTQPTSPPQPLVVSGVVAKGALTPPRPVSTASGSSTAPSTTTPTSTSTTPTSTTPTSTSTTPTSSSGGSGTTSAGVGSTTAIVLPAAVLPARSTVTSPNASVTVSFKPQTEPLTAAPSTAVVSHGTFNIASRTTNTLTMRLNLPASCRAATQASPNRSYPTTVSIHRGHTAVRTRQVIAGSHMTIWTLRYGCLGTRVTVTEGLVVVTVLRGRHHEVYIRAGQSRFFPS